MNDLKIPKGYALVWLDRSYDQRADAIIAFNCCDGDLDDKLGAAFLATVRASPALPEKRASVRLEGFSDYHERKK